ncbi:hypothetical protein KIW84_UN0905 [Lathyrus oleraceus]|nr:hypothetical protein KIW84_UN0905 [Pisum sativum]
MPSAEEPALLYATICLRALALWGVVRPAMLDLAVVGAVINGCYLVDPASSHMLVSKIKPCMFKKLVVGPWVGLIGPPLVCTGWLVPSAGDALLPIAGRCDSVRIAADVGEFACPRRWSSPFNLFI